MGSDNAIELTYSNGCWIGYFFLMASACEVHIRTDNALQAEKLIRSAYHEGKRIETKLSRYLTNNIVAKINASGHMAIAVDDELQALLNYADTLFDLSNGMFDITSGVLRKIWSFEKENIKKNNFIEPSTQQLYSHLEKVGWDKVHWQPPYIQLKQGMEIDLGGLGKEYAVDKVAEIISSNFDGQYLVNFGGDCRCVGSKQNPWVIAIEPSENDCHTELDSASLVRGSIATSGTTKRYIQVGSARYGHILNPQTGYPVENAPLSVTIIQETCIAAGAISTLAMLQGQKAEQYLQGQNLLYWCYR